MDDDDFMIDEAVEMMEQEQHTPLEDDDDILCHQTQEMVDDAAEGPIPPESPDRGEDDFFMIDPNKTFAEIDQELADKIKNKYLNMDKVECLYELQKMVDTWHTGRPQSPYEMMEMAMRVYGITDIHTSLCSNEEFDVQDLILKTNTMEREAVNLFHTMRLHNLLSGRDEVADPDDTVLDRDEEHRLRFMGLEITLVLNPTALFQTIMDIIEKMYNLRKVVMYVFSASMVNERRYAANNISEDLDDELNKIMHRFGWYDRMTGGQMKPAQNLLLYLLDCAFEQRLMKLEEDQVCNVYIPIMENKRMNQYAYEYLCPLEEWVMEQTGKEHEFTQWQNLTASGSNFDFCVKHLTVTKDYQMPTLHRNRCLFSFKNGIYDAEAQKFHEYLPDGGIEGIVEGVAAKHFKGVMFDPYEEVNDWRDIETPNLDHILEYQDIRDEAKDWMYILLGRMLYDINTWDNWQCAIYLKGYGGMYVFVVVCCLVSQHPMYHTGTGKTTICQLAGDFYESKSVGTLSNNSERKFGLSALLGKYIFKAPEIKSDMQLDQAELQSMISGEEVCVFFSYCCCWIYCCYWVVCR